jgi:hypothetical protein
MDNVDSGACISAEQSLPSQKAFKVLFGQTTGHGQVHLSAHMPSVEEEWNADCHAPNWPDITKVNPVKWWDVRT